MYTGDDDGIIKESVLVYKVKKNANVLDYHENINKEGFIKWFKDLLELWKTKNVNRNWQIRHQIFE